MEKILSPLNLFWIVMLLAAFFSWRKKKKTARRLSIIAITELFIFSVSPLPVWMIRNLEQQYPPVELNRLPPDIPVMVLGGGHTNDPALPPIHRLSGAALNRLTEGVRIYNIGKNRTFVLSGYTAIQKDPQAVLMAKTAVALGVKPADTIMLTRPATTWDEAQEFKKRFGKGKKLILVTSASHLPRAVQTFKWAGLHPVPAPANYQIRHDPDELLYNWWPSANKITYTEKATHEYIGLLYYRWFK